MDKHLKSIGISFLLIVMLVFGFNYYFHDDVFYFIKPSLKDEIPRIAFKSDLDQDGLSDLDDILQGAHKEVNNKTKYKSVYYSGGYPPKNEGVCTDVIWRALANAGYNIKEDIDEDIKTYLWDYPGVESPDPNIDFRRVVNLNVFMKKYMDDFTLDVIPYNIDNLFDWQAGDIVVLNQASHIAIISDKRRKDGVPYVLHNAYKNATEEDVLLKWFDEERIIGHYRFKNQL